MRISCDVASLALSDPDHENTDIAPGVLDAWQNLARLQLALNDVAGARASLLAMSEVAPEKETRDRIMDAFEAESK